MESYQTFFALVNNRKNRVIVTLDRNRSLPHNQEDMEKIVSMIATTKDIISARSDQCLAVDVNTTARFSSETGSIVNFYRTGLKDIPNTQQGAKTNVWAIIDNQTMRAILQTDSAVQQITAMAYALHKAFEDKMDNLF